MESGGYANVWSIRFQNLWAVRQLLLLLAEDLRSVRIEPAGREGEGIDLIVTLPSGHTEYQQCKRSHRETGKWTLRALAGEGVLSAIRDHLRADREATFCLVSADSAPELRGLAESARASLDAPSFYRDQVQASVKRTGDFESFCGSLGLDPAHGAHLIEARDLLSRTFVRLAGDDEGDLRELKSISRFWVDGDPAAVVAALESFAQKTLRQAITAADVESAMRSHGFHLRPLARDTRILPAVRRLQERFEAQLRPQVVRGRLLPRDETTELLRLLGDSSGPRFIAVHGAAGVGKSGVLLDLIDRLKKQGTFYLPLRLDRQRPSGTTRRFGEDHGLQESPVLCLAALSDDRPAVLLLDQLDALRWTGAHAAEALETCRQLVDEALRHPNFRVVACCRTVDLENDPQIRGWMGHAKAQKLPVNRLSEKVVREVVSAAGVDPASLTGRQVNLLRTIQHLRAWEETVRITGGTVHFGSERELLDEFWKSRLLEATRMGIAQELVQDVVDEIVDFMDHNSVLVAPRRLLHGHPGVEQVLLSLNVLTFSEGGFSFCHQSYLDHQLAHMLLRYIDEGSVTVETWLTSSDQGLSRREQLRLVLGMLREERFDQYLATVRGLIASSSLRFHLKQLVLQFLGQAESPQGSEIELVLSLLLVEGWKLHVVADVLYAHTPWFDAADRAGVVARWLGGNDRERDNAFSLVFSVAEARGETCSRLLSPSVSRDEESARRVAAVLPMAPAKDSPSLFDLRVRLAECGIDRHHIDWRELGGANLSRLLRLVLAMLPSLTGNEGEQRRYDSIFYGINDVKLADNSTGELVAAWMALIPIAAKVINPEADGEGRPPLVELRGWRSHVRDLLRQLAAELVSRDLPALLGLADEHQNGLGELLVLEELSRVEVPEAAAQALEWLMSKPHRLQLRWTSSDLRWELSQRAVRELTRCCSLGACLSFERFILDFMESDLGEAMKRRHALLLSPSETLPRLAASVLARPSVAGQTAYHLLPCLPSNRLSPAGRRRLEELRRKFGAVDDLFFSGARFGWVGSPIPADRLNVLSDRSWLEIIAGNAEGGPRERRPWRFRDGGFLESTPKTFSTDLGNAAAREPGRFARLALRFPANANPLYFRSLLQGLHAGGRKDPPEEDATLNELESVLTLPRVRSDESLARDVAWLVRDRAHFRWSQSTFELLAAIATQHHDPADGELHVLGDQWEDRGPESLQNNALNCTRGAAACAIADLLSADPGRLEAFAGAIERVVADPHPAVRAAGLRCCLSALGPDPERAIAWALKAVKGYEALLACSWFNRFLRYAFPHQPSAIEQSVSRMLTAAREDVVEAGARHAVGLYLSAGRMREAALASVRGSVPQRTGAAYVAAALADSPQHHEKARAMLVELMNDEAESVLAQCAWAFRETTLELFAAAPDFLDAYASSRAFLRQPTDLLERLHEHSGSLLPFASCVLQVCRTLAASRGQDAQERQRAYLEVDHFLPPVLLRLYEQAPNGSGVRKQCLGAWDLLLEARLVSAINLTKQLETDSSPLLASSAQAGQP